MAVGVRLTFAGGTQEQYDAIHDHMEVDENPPIGLIFHSAGPIDGGWGVVDVWESRAAFDAFVGARLQPSVGELGERTFAGPPVAEEFAVYRYTKP